ncbi:MAG TPA: hypothetical protein DHW82_00865 [Spirochaetia bacterium]|nr:MAG: hypothetical protein A2Y41_07965 [Spirochaetes bacterium GWB1_36_13]HCL55549.1 hypothetical protein [Spirochaetia bacterium]
MIKKLFMVIFAGMTILLSSCIGSMIKSAMISAPYANFISLHSNPKVGDYAVLSSQDDLTTYKYMITSVNDESVFVKLVINSKESEYFNDFYWELETDLKGNVKNAYLVSLNGDRDKLTIATPGKMGYFYPIQAETNELKKFVEENTKEKFKTSAGSFDVKAEFYESIVNYGNVNKLITVMFVNPDVKFLTVANFNMKILNDGTKDVVYSYLIEQGNENTKSK